MKKTIVTIDGPAASGKEKIAKYISRKFNFKHLDSGILYRKIAYILIKKKIDSNDLHKIKKVLKEEKIISFRKSHKLRSEHVSSIASKIAVHQIVRNYVNKLQVDFVNFDLKCSKFVIDGRDIGSVVFKNADLKLYIDVSEENRAKRRYKQLIDTGEKSIYPQILKDIKLRDKKDKNRINSPLVIPKGAIIVDNNGSFKRTITKINNLMNRI